jgi:hypothetical protein
VCAELPDTFDGVHPISEQDVAQFVTVLRLELQSELDAEYDESERMCEGRKNWRYPTAPTISLEYTFDWRERSGGWQPARPDDPTCTECLKVPVVTFTVRNNWAYSRLVSTLDDKVLYCRLGQEELASIAENDIHQILDELISLIPAAMVLLIFFEQGETTTLLAASPKNINCLTLLKEYSPSGAKRLLWLDLPSPIATAQEEILKLVTSKLEKIN